MSDGKMAWKGCDSSMKNKQFLLILAVSLLLSACSGNETEDPVTEMEHHENNEVSKNRNEGTEDSEKETTEEKVTGSSEQVPTENEEQPLYEISEKNWTLVPISDANPKAVLLTIDDAPDRYALTMAQTLKELHAPAIFFVNGHFLNSDEAKNSLKQIHELGFAIGNHTVSHSDLKKLSEPEQKDEMVQVNDAVEGIIGERPNFFRAPFGSNTDYSRSLAKEQKMLAMNWTYGYDWEKEYRNAEALTDIMLTTPYLTDGAILLMHDRQWTAESLTGIVEGLRAAGYVLIDPDTIKGVE